MGFFSIFKKDKGNENNEENGNFLENYFNSRFMINTDKELKDLKLDCIREHKSAIDMVTSFSIDKYLIS